jgi:signal transduction histidine kinase
MAQMDGRHKPTFLWQGTLILLPCVLLAAVGFLSLRQDRLLARQAATQRAQGLADQLAPEIWRALTAPGSGDGRQFQVDAEGRLAFPPPCALNPVPRPLNPSTLAPEAAALWRKAQRAEAGGTAPAAALQAYRELLARHPPRPFAAAAHYSLGLLLAAEKDTGAALAQFELVRDRYADLPSDGGLPLGMLAGFKTAELVGAEAPRKQMAVIDGVCSNAVYHPTVLSPLVLQLLAERAGAPEIKTTVQRWQGLWETQTAARNLYAAAQGQLRRETWTWFIASAESSPRVQERWLALPTAGNRTNTTYLCRSESELGKLVTALADNTRGVPEYFGLGVDLAGERVMSYAPDLRVWTQAHHMTQGGGYDEREYSTNSTAELLASAAAPDAGPSQVRIGVYLTSPAMLFSLQTARTFWFGALIAAAALAAFIGLGAASRAFHRQLRLSEMKSNFVSSVSHELRAPLASVRLLAESLERGKITEGGKQQEYFHFIVQECRRLSSLIENVLDFSRIEQGRKQYEFEPTDLAALTEQTVRLMQPYAVESGVRLEQAAIEPQLKSPEPHLALDGKAIQQALVNLVDNAIKYSPKGGIVRVGLELQCREAPHLEAEHLLPKTSLAPAPSWEDSALRPTTSLIRLWVQDQGPGIPAAEHERIFERFYRRGNELRRQTQGVGIGLSIVKHIVEAHGGRVRVQSQPGAGSRFTIELPQTSLTTDEYG